MCEFFVTIVNMSISASWIVLAVLMLRLLLKKAPKWINVLLWGIVAVRLICPFSFESVLSLIPSSQTINPETALNSPVIDSGVAIIDNAINPIVGEATISVQPEKDVNLFQFIMPYLAGVWLVGISALLIYTLISFLRLKSKIGTAVLFRDNIYQSEAVVSPFVLGIIKPKIYLPFNMNGQDMDHVIAHEQAHIRRKDHLWKPLGFLILTLHWFNPLVWFGYILLCRDIELACDEKVVKELNAEQKADYSQALLNCSVNRSMIAACPLAFGEVGVKNRVKSVLNYKKPAFWIIIVAIIVSITVAVCFLTNPVNTSIYNSSYETGKCLYCYVVSADKETKSNELIFDITSDGKVYKTFGDGTTEELGVLKESDYTAEELEAAIKNQVEKLNIGTIKTAYKLSDYIFLQKSNGTVYLVQFFSDGRIMSVFKLNRIDKSDIPNGSYKLSKEIYFNGAYSYVPNFENDRIEIKTNGGMHIYHFTGEELSTGGLYEEIKLNKENFSNLLDGSTGWGKYENAGELLKNNKRAWYHSIPQDFDGYPYMLLLQKDGSLYIAFADLENGTPTRVRYIYELEYEGNIETGYDSTVGGSEKLAWIYNPLLSYTGHYTIAFAFNCEYTYVDATCTGGAFCNLEDEGQPHGNNIRFEKEKKIYWTPAEDDENPTDKSEVTFTVYNGDTKMQQHTVIFECVSRNYSTGDVYEFYLKDAMEFALVSSEYGCLTFVERSPNSDIGSADGTSDVIVSTTIEELKVKYPQFFNVSTDGGLTVYIWQMSKNNFQCYLINRSIDTLADQSFAFEVGATIAEMRTILTSYDIAQKDIVLHPVNNPLSSYLYEITDEYREKVTELFWSTVPYGSSSEYSPVIDTATFDIDGDGKEEQCALNTGPTHGIFTFVLSVSENGKLEYYNIYTGLAGEISFESTTDETKLHLVPLGKSEPIDYSFSVRNGNIVLTANGENLAYWGEQGINSAYAPKAISDLNTAIAEALSDKYQPEMPDGLIHIENYCLLANDTVSGTPLKGNSGHKEITNVYLLVYYMKYTVNGGSPEETEGGFVPTAITFTVDENGEYTLEDYWTAGSGTDYETDVRNKFPGTSADDALNTEKYAEELIKENRRLANEALSAITDR